MLAAALVVLASYLIGAIPVAYIAGRLKGIDIRTVGSGNIGATNVFRKNRAVGILTFLLDAGKGYLAVVAAGWLGGDIGVGLIEESAKLIFPLALFVMWRYRRLSDGILIGAASGMGFAVLETIGRVLIASSSGGNVGYTLLTRGIFTPFGHPAWTALICAFLWRERLSGKPRVALIMAIYILAVLLHGVWDAANQLNIPDIATAGLLVLISIITLSLLFFQFEKAEKENNGV
jgi:RsiW-degrading membrane proteinase PrsW (M82 family)